MDSRKAKGYILGFVAAATYGLNPLFALPLMADGMDASSILLFRYLLAIPIVALMMAVRGRSFAVSSISLFESYRYMDAGIASTLLFVYPLMVAVIMSAFFHERMSRLTIVCLTAALAGIGLLYKGEGGGTLSPLGTAIVMLSALTYAIYIVGINKTELSKVPTLTVTFYVLIFGMIVFAVNLLMKGHVDVPSGISQWLGVGALALLPTAVSFLCTTMAIIYVGSTPTAILGAMEPLTAVIIGMTVFGERLTVRDVLGLSLIVIAVTLVVVGGSVSKHLTNIKRLFPRVKR